MGSGHGVAHSHDVAVRGHLLHRPHEVGERFTVRGNEGEKRVQTMLLRLSRVVHGDVGADELLCQRNIPSGKELTGVAAP